MSRISFKVTGAQGQGINSVGEMVAKGLKRAGFHVFGYREYMSLIKGGHSSYQLDIAETHIESTESKVDVLVCLNYIGLKRDLVDLKENGILLHLIPDWKFSDADKKLFEDRNIKVLYLPMEKILKELNSRPIVGNVLVTSVVWGLLGRDYENLKAMIKEQFGHKGEKIVNLNYQFIDQGKKYKEENAKDIVLPLPKPDAKRNNDLLVTGSEAMGLGIVHAGCRLYAGYPMTPSSPLLHYIAHHQNESGMIVKQAEDEITAAELCAGAMHMGARAITSTSGGGFDLMSETISLCGITENPFVMVLAMRQGPSTGLPTWSGQGDLLLAVGGSHGEFPRLVMSVSNAEDCFSLMPEAMNYAEEYQLPVIVLTDKQIAEGLYMQPPYDLKSTKMRRGKLVVKQAELSKLKSSDRYDPHAEGGVSSRWLPGAEAATYCAQGDEHGAEGQVDETAQNAKDQMHKRMLKMETMKMKLPEPELFGAKDPETLIVSWGSNRGAIEDVMGEVGKSGTRVGYLHYTYLWPLRTEKLEALAKKAKKTIVGESTDQGQLSMLLKSQCGITFHHTILKYDGRPFFVDEMLSLLSQPQP